MIRLLENKKSPYKLKIPFINFNFSDKNISKRSYLNNNLPIKSPRSNSPRDLYSLKINKPFLNTYNKCDNNDQNLKLIQDKKLNYIIVNKYIGKYGWKLNISGDEKTAKVANNKSIK